MPFLLNLSTCSEIFCPNHCFRTLICCPIAGNYSNIREYRFHGKYVAKKFSQNTFLVSDSIFKVAANQRDTVWKRKNHLEAPEQVTRVVYLHLVLFRMHEGHTGTDKEFHTITDDTRTRPQSEI